MRGLIVHVPHPTKFVRHRVLRLVVDADQMDPSVFHVLRKKHAQQLAKTHGGMEAHLALDWTGLQHETQKLFLSGGVGEDAFTTSRSLCNVLNNLFIHRMMSKTNPSNRPSFAYFIVGGLLLLTLINIAIIRYRQRDLSQFSDSQVPRIMELNQCQRRSFSRDDVSSVTSKILKADMKPPQGVRSVAKETLTDAQIADLHEAIELFLITYQSPTPQSVYDYYIINRGGEKMRDASVEIAEKNIKRLKMDVDRSEDRNLMYIKVYWDGLGREHPDRLKTHWQFLLDGSAAYSACLWETSSPLSNKQVAINSADRDTFGNTSNSVVFFECKINPEDLLNARKKVLFADIQFAIELDKLYDKEIVTFARRYWFNEATGKWFPFEGTALVVPSKRNYNPYVMF